MSLTRLLSVLVMLLAAASCTLVDAIDDQIDEFDPAVFDNVDPNSVFTLTVVSDTIPADGLSTVELTVTLIPKNPDADKREVTFTTSAGTLLGAVEGKLKVTLAAGQRQAVAVLQSSQRVETAFVQATLAGVIRQETVWFKAVNPDNVFTLALSDTTLVADGVTSVMLTATLGASAPTGTAGQTVTFTTTTGTFGSNSSINVPTFFSAEAQAFIAQAHLRSIRAGTASLVARIGHFIQRGTIALGPVAPRDIEIVVDAGGFGLKADSSFSETTMITAMLKARSGGIASVGTPVNFMALDSANQIIPGFHKPTDGFRAVMPSNEQGVASAVFSVGGTPYRGLVKLFATLAADSTIQGMDVIQIIKPDDG